MELWHNNGGFNSCEACTVYLFRGGIAAHDATFLTRNTCTGPDYAPSELCGYYHNHDAPLL